MADGLNQGKISLKQGLVFFCKNYMMVLTRGLTCMLCTEDLSQKVEGELPWSDLFAKKSSSVTALPWL